MLSHEGDIVKDLLANGSHVLLLEPQKLLVFRNLEQVDVFEAVFLDFEGHVNLAIDDTAFQVKLIDLVLHVEE